MNLFQIKIRRAFYLSMCVLFNLSLLIGIFTLFNSNMSVGIIGVSFISLLSYILSYGLLIMLEDKIDSRGFSSFIFSLLFISRRNKFVYHNELGYFTCIIFKGRISVHYQGLFYMRDIVDIENKGKKEFIALKIKLELDSQYKHKINREMERQNELYQLEEISKWDGFLDKESRRDQKIKRLIK